MCKKWVHFASFLFVFGLAGQSLAEIAKDPNLVLFYSYDTVGAIVPDESGKGHNGTVCGDVSLAESGIKWYGAAEFLGEWGPTGYSYLDLDSPHYDTADIPKSAVTLAAWVKCRKTGKDHAIISCRASDNTWVVHPQINDNGSYRWLLRGPGSVTIFNLNGVGSHGWDEWHHYAGTYDCTIGKGILYIDGQLCATADTPVGQTIADWGTGARVGYNIDNARPFTGLMDELYLFTRALSQTEVNTLLEAEGLASEKATHPNPADGSELTITSTVLQWLPGTYAVSNDVYFGTNFDDVDNGTGDTFKGNQTDPQYVLTDLQWGTTYYWRIDGVNPDEPNSPWKGDVWSFMLRPSTAWNPTPSDGAQWIDPNTTFTWSEGRGETQHYVYFGDTFDDVNNATGAAAQTEASYYPGLLDVDKTYYWRVDELDETGVMNKGAVWSFTTRSAESGLMGEYYSDMKLENLVLTRVDPGINFNWGEESPDATVPADGFSVRWTGELEVPFTSSWTFTVNCDDCVRLWINGQLLFDKWGQQSGVEWVGTLDLAEGQKYSVVMEYYENTGDARAILYWNSPSSLTPYLPKQAIPQGAFSLPVRARSPRPANGAVDTLQTSILQWTAGGEAVSHDVYFGEDAAAVANADTTTTDIYRGRQDLDNVTFDPGPLEWNKTYYWRVDEVNDANPESPWKGAVWAFTTADFLIVDNFETYTDDWENLQRIFQIWIDGSGYTMPEPGEAGNGSGALVGTNEAPWVELDVVYSGEQAMPMTYRNADSPYYSEVQRTWAEPQDWTINGVGILVLYVQGSSLNELGQLYVTLTDGAGNTATVAYPDTTVTRSITWVEWKIPVSDFAGITATQIEQMAIGVDNRSNSAMGGAGTIYVDDIRLIRP